jgi:cytochrome P450
MTLAPMPPAEPLFGHARALARDPLRTLLRWRDDYGPVVRFRVGSREAHVVFSPATIRRVLSDPDGIYGKDTHGYRTLRLFIGDGLLTSEGERWVRQRKLLQPSFHRQRLSGYVRTMVDVAERALENLLLEPGPVRIDEAACRVTLEIVSRTLFGDNLLGSAAELGRAIGDLQVAANRRISAAVTLPASIPTPEHLRIRRARRRLRSILGALLVERRRKALGREQPDLFDLLLSARDAETGAPLPDELVLDELVTMLIAGHESTANALTWALTVLATNPSELARLREECDRGAVPRDFEGMAKLSRTRSVVDETLRLFPPAWSFGRAPRRSDEIAGFTVPAGGLVMIAPWVTHRDPSLFAHPEAFDSSRFWARDPQPFSYLPFGGGPRTCIGHGFARVEAQAILAVWLGRADFELVGGQDLEPVPLITLRPKNGVRMRVRRRR